jgi:hypothetical protein
MVRLLDPTFRSIDVRVLAVRIEHEWKAAAAVVSLTRAPLEDVEDQHARLLKRQADIKAPRCTLLVSGLPGARLPSLLEDLGQGFVRVNDQRLLLGNGREQPWRPVKGGRMFGSHYVTRGNEDRQFSRYLYSIRTGRSAEELLADAGVDPGRLGLASWVEINTWLECGYFDPNCVTAVNLELICPVYAALLDVPSISASNFVVQGEVHGALQANLLARGRVLRNDREALRSTAIPVPRPARTDDLNAFYLVYASRADHPRACRSRRDPAHV